MKNYVHFRGWRYRLALVCVLVSTTTIAEAGPVLSSIYPSGARAGTTVDIKLGNIDDANDLYLSLPGVRVRKIGEKEFSVSIPSEAPAGAYDIYALSPSGLSSPRIFTVGRLPEALESDANEDVASAIAQPHGLDTDGAHGIIINGRLEKTGDFDYHGFTAKKGQVVVVECWAERIDSALRALVELYDHRGRRLHMQRHLIGVDPLLVFRVPADGLYVAKVSDLTHTSSDEHFYRLVLDTGPRVLFTDPCVLETGQTTTVTLHGWNLTPSAMALPLGDGTGGISTTASSVNRSPLYDQTEVTINPPAHVANLPLPFHRRSTQLAVTGFTYRHPQSNTPTLISLCDTTIVDDDDHNQTHAQAQDIEFPCEIAGQLLTPGEEDWFAIRVRRGEVLWFEGFGERIDSPVDLEITLLNTTGSEELANFSDMRHNHGGLRFPTDHCDPSGRWVAPADGRYLLLIRNATGSLQTDPRRVYRVSVRREEPDFQLTLASQQSKNPEAINVTAGGRKSVDIIALRNRGATGSIRISAVEVPRGFECPDVWLHPGASHAPLIIGAAPKSSHEKVPNIGGVLRLVGRTRISGGEIVRPVTGSVMTRGGLPLGLARLTEEIPLCVTPELPLRITARHVETTHVLAERVKEFPEPRVSQASVITLSVEAERLNSNLVVGEITLSGQSLPRGVQNQLSLITEQKERGFISFYLPPSLPPGRYTVVVKGQASLRDISEESPPHDITVFSNPVSFEVYLAPFIVEIDPKQPTKIRRGETIQIHYTARRQNGFIGKIHTEMVAPNGVVGLRGRGVSFISQTEGGNIQIIANEDAPLGAADFLRFEGAGYIEDEIVYLVSCFVDLEVIE